MYQATAFAVGVIQGQRHLLPTSLHSFSDSFFPFLKIIDWQSQRPSLVYRKFFDKKIQPGRCTPVFSCYSNQWGFMSTKVNDFAPHIRDRLMVGGTFLGDLAGLFGAIPGFIFPSIFAYFSGTLWPFIQGGTGFACGLLWTYHNVYAKLPSDEFSKVGLTILTSQA
jgi:hypothetical protein